MADIIRLALARTSDQPIVACDHCVRACTTLLRVLKLCACAHFNSTLFQN